MKEREFWRERSGGHVYAVELDDGVVTGTCGPLEPHDIEESFLPTFDYSGDDVARVEGHRAEFDLHRPVPGLVPTATHESVLGHKRVSDVMHPGVMTCHSGSSLFDVARTMVAHGVHAVAVWGDEGEDSVGFRGMISDLDLLTAVMRGESLASSALTAVRRTPHTVRAGADVSEGAQLMVDEGATHVIVVADDRDRIVGVLSALDVARALTLG
jgi:CBS domain-containing protein